MQLIVEQKKTLFAIRNRRRILVKKIDLSTIN